MEQVEKLKLFDPKLPLDEAHSIPKAWYQDSDIYELEREKIFSSLWQFVGRAEQVSESGSYLSALIAEEPVVITRDKQGKLNAFSNVCRHKAALIAREECGKSSFLQCQYHGWTYDLEGNLKGMPECEGIKNFKKEENGLKKYAIETWGPFLFVHLGTPEVSLREFLSPLSECNGFQQLESLRWMKRVHYEVACNWKIYVDNYLDGGYHINTIHPGLAEALNYKEYRTEIRQETCVQYSPLENDPKKEVTEVRKGKNAYYWWVMPNFMINIYEGMMDTNWVIPLSKDRTQVVFDFYFTDTEGIDARSRIEKSILVADQVQIEDQGVCENVQRGLRSRTYQTARFSPKRENGAYFFHQELHRRLTH